MNESADRLNLPRSAVAVLIAFGLIGGALLAIEDKDYPDLHTILDTGMALLSGVLALLLWELGTRIGRPFPKWVAVSFAVTSLLELIHVMVTVEWSGAFAPIAEAQSFLRPSTWPPAAHVLPIGIGFAIWLMHRGRHGVLGCALVMTVMAAGLFEAFRWLPTYTQPVPLGISRPALVLAPLLWAAVGWLCWRRRAVDRMAPPLAVMAAVLLLANFVMLYSQAPHDTPAMVAHLGKVGGYLVLLLTLMQMASHDMLERIRAEAQLARLNEELERRVVDRTAQLESANETLEGEIAVRRQAEQKAQAQLGRLNLLHQITRAIGERQDLNSIFQVVVRSLEDQLPVDFACLCLHDPVGRILTVTCVGAKSAALAAELAMTQRAHINIDENGLSRCLRGQLVYEADISQSTFSFPQRLARGGLQSIVVAPLQVESHVFGVLVVARVRVNGFNSGECEFLRQLSEHVGLASHQAQLYGALQRAYEDLRQTQQTVMQQERLRALGQMASGIAHDINNALTPASLYTEQILDSEAGLSARARQYLEIIQRAVDDVTHTVARMNDFYRQREPELALASVHVNQLVPQVVNLTRARWSDMPLQRGVVIQVRTDLAVDPPAIMGVESEIRDALTNLILNAVDALPGGGTLTLKTRTITASQHRHVQIEVADNGAGMDEDTRRRCLEPFFTTKGERGTGLGLAMVYGTVQRHGAEMDITSAPGKGTAVCLTFPVPVATPMTPDQAKMEPVVLSRLRLLVVDDDPLLLKSLRDVLEANGHVVVTASDGQAGIDAFRGAHERGEIFAAVITDLGMPYVDGRKVASAVKATSPGTPVILLTGWGQRLVADEDIPPYVDRVLSKPPKLRELRAALAHFCRPAAP